MNNPLLVLLAAGCVTAAGAQAPARPAPLPYHGAAPRVSPDGRHVLFSRDSGGVRRSYIMDSGGANQRMLPPGAGGGIWFPDSRQILMVFLGQSRTSPAKLAVMNTDGTGLHELAGAIPSFAGAQFLPGGKKIAVATAVRDSVTHAVTLTQTIMDLARSPGRSLPVPGYTGRLMNVPVLSHDGRHMAYVAADTTDPSTPFRASTLYITGVDGSGRKAIATLPDGLELPVWSTDDRRIALQHDGHEPRNRALLPADYVPDASIVVIDVATGAVHDIAHPDRKYLDEVPSWAPDGSLFIQSNRDGQMEIYRMNADGSNPKRITR